MKLISGFFLSLFAVIAATGAPRTITLAGTLTNTTEEVSADATLVLTIEGEKLTVRLKTEPPLSGTGTLEGRILGGWCDLHGQLDEGVVLQLRGVLNAKDFRGTYLAAVPGSLLQYGKFELVQAETAEGEPPPRPAAQKKAGENAGL